MMAPPPSSNALSIVGYVTAGISLILINIFAGIRFYSRYVNWGTVNIEEVVCIIAWFCTNSCYIGCILFIYFGGGHHIWELDDSEVVTIRKVTYEILLSYVLSVLFIKLLLLATLIRIFVPRAKMYLFVRLFTAFITAYYTASFLVRIFICTPISHYWNRTGGHCVDIFVLFTIDLFMSLITDGVILALSIILAWPLHLPVTKKIKIVAALGTGGLATITNIYRVVLIFQQGRSSDETWFFTRLLYGGIAETVLGFVCACLPALNALVIRQNQWSGNRNRPSPRNKYPMVHMSA